MEAKLLAFRATYQIHDPKDRKHDASVPILLRQTNSVPIDQVERSRPTYG